MFWHFDSLFYYSDAEFNYQVQMPSYLSIGDTIQNDLFVHQLDSLNNPIDTIPFYLNQILVCAFDPNDKNVTPKGEGPEGYIANNQELEYLVRFQNTGNDTALVVTIRDTLDTNLDWNSLYPISSSHAVQVSVSELGEAVFYFPNIMLPDSNVNEVASHGYIRYKINMLPNLLPGQEIQNVANIYFDLNPPVVTNTVLNTIELEVDDTGLYEFEIESFNLYPNPSQTEITIDYPNYKSNQVNITIYDLSGRIVLPTNVLKTNQAKIDISALRKGIYTVAIVDLSSNLRLSKRLIVL